MPDKTPRPLRDHKIKRRSLYYLQGVHTFSRYYPDYLLDAHSFRNVSSLRLWGDLSQAPQQQQIIFSSALATFLRLDRSSLYIFAQTFHPGKNSAPPYTPNVCFSYYISRQIIPAKKYLLQFTFRGTPA